MSIINIFNKPCHWLPGRCYSRRLVAHQQWYRPSNNMRQAQPVWRTKSYNFKREAWEGNVLFFKYILKVFVNYLAGVICLWLMAVPFILPTPLFRRESRRKRFFNSNFQVYFDFAYNTNKLILLFYLQCVCI
jgi:hypothetical protein